MAPRTGVAETEPAAPPRCLRCGARVGGTVHTRSGYRVGHYRLHTGRTVEATFRRREEEAAIAYRRLVEAVDRVACAGCFARPDVQRLWLAFGDPEAAGSVAPAGLG
jgi:hypothetical protein